MIQEALKLALEKIATVNAMDYEYQAWAREALAQTQEPAACPYCKNSATLGAVYYDQNCVGCVKRMTTPLQRKPLTDEEMKKIWYAMQNIMGWYSFQEIARAIEAAHGIKEKQNEQ